MCHFFSKKTEFEKERASTKPESNRKGKANRKGSSTIQGSKNKNNEDHGYDDIFDDAHDFFVTDDGDKSMSEESTGFSGDYLTEQAHCNDLESSLSITERSSKFLLNIYIELLRIIRPIEKKNSYKKQQPDKGSNNTDQDMAGITLSARGSTCEEDELDDDRLLMEAEEQKRMQGAKKGN